MTRKSIPNNEIEEDNKEINKQITIRKIEEDINIKMTQPNT